MGDLHVSLFPLVTILSPRFGLLLSGAFQIWTINDLVYGFDENFSHFFQLWPIYKVNWPQFEKNSAETVGDYWRNQTVELAKK